MTPWFYNTVFISCRLKNDISWLITKPLHVLRYCEGRFLFWYYKGWSLLARYQMHFSFYFYYKTVLHSNFFFMERNRIKCKRKYLSISYFIIFKCTSLMNAWLLFTGYSIYNFSSIFKVMHYIKLQKNFSQITKFIYFKLLFYYLVF